MKSAPAIAFDYRPSRTLAALAGAIAILAVFSIVASDLALPLKIVLALAASILAVRGIARFLDAPYVRIARDAMGWQVVDRHGDGFAASLRSHLRRGPLLVLDLVTADGRAFRCVVAPDVIDAELRRRLILVLATEPAR